MNKQTTAIEWWENTVYNAAKRVEWKIKLNFKYYGWDKDYNRLTDEEIEHIYLSENPQTETKVEDVQVGGFTGGEWHIGITTQNHVIGEWRTGVSANTTMAATAKGKTQKESEANAKRIVQAVNNFDAMYSALKDTVYEYENATKAASIDEIKKAYRALAKKYHPDSSTGN